MKSVVRSGVIAALCLGSGLVVLPSQAQGPGFMWCSAIATNGNDTTQYYSGVFAASASEASAKAAAFKDEVEEAEASAAAIRSSCHAAPDQASATQALGAARASAPGQVLDWAG